MDGYEVFKQLKLQLRVESEIDCVVSGLERLSAVLSPALGARGEAVQAVVAEVKTDLLRLRERTGGARGVFSGQGLLGKRLADAALIEETLYGKPTPKRHAQAAQLLGGFNYQPIDEYNQVQEVQSFLTHLFQQLQLENSKITPVVPFSPVSPDQATTGFMYQDDGDGGIAHGLVLAGKLEPTDVRMVVAVGTYQQPMVYLYHPQELQWLQVDCSWVLPGMIECMERELAKAHAELQALHDKRDWPQEFEAVQAKAREVFAQSDCLPAQLGAFTRHTEQALEICVLESGHRVMFSHTRGDYPSESVSFLNHHGANFGFSKRFEEFALTLQQRFVYSLHRELDKLLDAIATTQQVASEAAL